MAWGVVNQIAPSGKVLDSALEVAARIAANAPLAVRAIKRAIDDGEGHDLHRGMALEMVSDNVRILLAEDHPANQRVVQLLLEPLGVELTIVEDGQAALDKLANEAFDVVLMDMQMPVMDGLTATVALRLHEAATGAARTPVIMLTANALDDHVRASVEAGADRHLSKPIRADALIGAISEVIAEREAAVAEEVA